MKISKLIALGFAVVALASCEGPEGPAGATGPAGPAGASGDNADFAYNDIPVNAADFTDGYVEYNVDFITQDIFDNGICLAYIKDAFEYWNGIPSQWHEITGFTYVYNEANSTGVVGFDAVNGITTDYEARIVTMTARQYLEVQELEIEADYLKVKNYLQGLEVK